jgi:hypothetical protein
MNMNIKQAAFLCALLLPPAVGCASMHDTFSSSDTDVPEGLLQYASEEHLDDVEEARAAHNKAVDQLAAARRDEADAKAQNKVLREQVSLAEQSVEVERARVAARATGKTTAVVEAEEQMVAAERQVVAARRNVDLNTRRIKVRGAEVTVAEAEVRVAERRVELAKARAVAPLDRPEAAKVDVREFEAEVREEETKLELAKVERDAANREFDIFEKSAPDDDHDTE